jgi:hypothetical protein
MSDTFKPEKDTNRSEFDGGKRVLTYMIILTLYTLNDEEKEEIPENIYSLNEVHDHDNEHENDINAARGYRNEVKDLPDEEIVWNK